VTDNRYDAIISGRTAQPRNNRADQLRDKYSAIIHDDTSNRAQLNALDASDPDTAARANRYERQIGVPARIAQDDIGTYDTMDRQRQVAAASAAHPNIGRFLANPRAAAVGSDDTPAMAAISQQFRAFWDRPKPKQSWLQWAKDLPSNIAGSIGAGIYGAAEGVTQTLRAAGEIADKVDPIRNVLDYATGTSARLDAAKAQYQRRTGRKAPDLLNDLIATQRASAERLRPKDQGFVASALYSGVESLPSTAIALASGLAGAPAAGLGALGVTTGGTSYGQARDEGYDPLASLNYAVAQGGVEVLTERIPVMKFLEDTKVGTPFFQRLAKNFAAEQVGEQTATAAQDFSQWAMIDSNHGKTFGDYLRERPEAAAQTALAVAATVGGSNVAIAAGEKVVNTAARIQAARRDGATLAGIVESAAKSKLKARDPDSFREFVTQTAEGTDAEHVYIPATAIDTFMQSEGFKDADGFFEELRPQLDEARATGGDVVVPVADVAARLAGTPAWEALKDDARLDAGGLSMRDTVDEGKRVAEQIDTRGAEVLQQAQDQATADEPRQAVYDDVKNKLLAIGQPTRVAEHNAAVFAANREAWGARLGMTAEQYHAANPVDFTRASFDTSGAAAVMDQPGTAAFDNWFGDSVVREESGAPLRVYHGSDASFTAFDANAERSTGTDAPGFFFTDNQNVAAGYGDNVMQTFLKMEVPLTFDFDGRSTIRLDGETLTPSQLVKKISAIRDGSEDVDSEGDLRAELEDAGWDYLSPEIDGLVLRNIDDSMTAGGEPATHYVAFEPTQIKSAVGNRGTFDPNDPSILNQGPRGQIALYGDRSVITLFERSDLSTLIHETGHLFLDELQRNATAENAPADVVADWQTVQQWFKDQGVWHGDRATTLNQMAANDDEEVPVEITSLTNVLTDPRPLSAMYQAGDVLMLNGEVGSVVSATDRNLVLKFPSGTRMVPRNTAGLEVAPIHLWQGGDNSAPVGGGIPREAHELWARGFERYAMEGKAPSSALQRAFAAFRGWLLRIYQVVDNLRAPITPEVREVMDRLLATQDAIDAYRDQQNVRSAWTDADQAGMTAAEWSAYQASLVKAQDDAYDALLYKTMHRIRVRKTQEWREAYRRYRADATTEIDAQPRFRLLRLLRTGKIARGNASFNAFGSHTVQFREGGPVETWSYEHRSDGRLIRTRTSEQGTSVETLIERKNGEELWLADYSKTAGSHDNPVQISKDAAAKVIEDELPASAKANNGEREIAARVDREWLQERYGDDAESRLPANVRVAGEGMDGDELADLTGFASGDEAIKALFEIADNTADMRTLGDKRQFRDRLIDDMAKAAATDAGITDPLTDGTIEEEAVAAISNDTQGDVLATELRHLARRTAAAPTPYRLARDWAKRKIDAGTVKDVASKSAQQRYARAAAKAGREFEAAIIAGDADAAFRHKQAQMLNHALFVESKAAGDEVDVIVRRMGRLADRAAMKSVDQDYFDRVHELLEKFDFRPKSQRFLDEKEGFNDWAAKRIAEGFEVAIPPRLAESGDHYSRIQLNELYALRDTVDSLVALGRHKQKLLDGQKEREFAAVKADILTNLRQLPDRFLPKKTFNEDTKRRSLRDVVAGGLKISTLALDMDHQNENGPMMNLLVHRATDAENKRARLRDLVMEPLAKLYTNMPAKQWKRLNELVTIPELTLRVGLGEDDPRLGKPITISRKELLAVALNTGNASNFDKMTQGERWNPATLRDVLNRELTAQDWKLVQAMWDNVGKLWPHIVETERALSGVVPEKVTPTPVDTPHGIFAGGYWPVVYDSDRSGNAEKNADKSADDMFGRRSGLATPKGHTITRTEATGPMTYSVEQILMNHVEKVITRLAYAEYARDVMRVMGEESVKGMIDLKLGREYRRQVAPWLQRQITSYVSLDGAKFMEKVLRYTRQGITVVGMGLRWSTGVAQISGLTASLGRLGAAQTPRLVNNMRRTIMALPAMMAGKTSDVHEFVFSRSEQMQRRLRESSVEVSTAFRKLSGKHSYVDNVMAWSMWHIGMVDLHLVSIPTWMTGYQKAIDEGMTDAQASSYADQMVVTSQGGGRAKDLSAWQAPASEAQKLFVMFYTPFNVIFNAQWEAARGVKRGDYARAANMTFFFLVAQTLADALLSGDWPDDDDKEWPEATIEWLARNVGFGLFSGIPFARDAATYGERKLSGQYASFGGTPIQRIFEDMGKSAANLYKVEEGEKEFGPDAIPGLANTAGTLFHLPLGQPGSSAKFLWQYQRGEVEPQSIGDWYTGLSKGKMAKDEKQ